MTHRGKTEHITFEHDASSRTLLRRSPGPPRMGQHTPGRSTHLADTGTPVICPPRPARPDVSTWRWSGTPPHRPAPPRRSQLLLLFLLLLALLSAAGRAVVCPYPSTPLFLPFLLLPFFCPQSRVLPRGRPWRRARGRSARILSACVCVGGRKAVAGDMER